MAIRFAWFSGPPLRSATARREVELRFRRHLKRRARVGVDLTVQRNFIEPRRTPLHGHLPFSPVLDVLRM